jgi:hypothetical protein
MLSSVVRGLRGEPTAPSSIGLNVLCLFCCSSMAELIASSQSLRTVTEPALTVTLLTLLVMLNSSWNSSLLGTLRLSWLSWRQ